MGERRSGHSKSVARNDFLEIIATRKEPFASGPNVQVVLYEQKVPDHRARFAMTCIERWAVVAAELDGEDSAGRAKVRRLTAEEVVKHALDCAHVAFQAFEREGWLVPVPPYRDLQNSVREAEDAND